MSLPTAPVAIPTPPERTCITPPNLEGPAPRRAFLFPTTPPDASTDLSLHRLRSSNARPEGVSGKTGDHRGGPHRPTRHDPEPRSGRRLRLEGRDPPMPWPR
jgi:hypothetical protein